ncbi:MAG: SCP2 sterol-binding domain-containing protein [FCB group bacterium]|nr:SCP2 sterol-binding domain-containing protein [FCB group bacterium]
MSTNLHNQYFAEFLPTIIGKQMMDGIEDFNGCIEIVVTDSDERPWRFGIKNGTLDYVGHDGPSPNCRFESDSKTLMQLITGEISSSTAFMEMRIEVTGDLDMALHLSLIMDEFFQRYPYVPRD